jgi:hypothetical protein
MDEVLLRYSMSVKYGCEAMDLILDPEFESPG